MPNLLKIFQSSAALLEWENAVDDRHDALLFKPGNQRFQHLPRARFDPVEPKITLEYFGEIDRRHQTAYQPYNRDGPTHRCRTDRLIE